MGRAAVAIAPAVAVDHVEREVGAVEVADVDDRIDKRERFADLGADPLGGRGGKRRHAGIGKELAQRGDLRISGAEIVAPLRDTMGLVDHDGPDVRLGEHGEKLRVVQPLRCEVKKLELAASRAQVDLGDLAMVQRAVGGGGFNAACDQGVDLVLHERDQRVDDQGQAVLDCGGCLIAERLSRSRGHDDQGVAVIAGGVEGLHLAGVQAGDAPCVAEPP